MDKIKVVKSQLRLQQWAERISECQASSMTVSAWCDAHDINIKTYYYWLRKVREVTVEYLLHNIITKNCRAKWRILHLQNGENCRGYSDHQAMKNPLQT